jgi:hypothetical protein
VPQPIRIGRSFDAGSLPGLLTIRQIPDALSGLPSLALPHFWCRLVPSRHWFAATLREIGREFTLYSEAFEAVERAIQTFPERSFAHARYLLT